MNRTPTAVTVLVTAVVATIAVLVGPAGRAWGAPGPPATVYAWPLGPPTPAVVRPFAAPTHRFGPGRRGVDLAGAPGAAVHAAAGGTVVFAGVLAGRGVVSVQHDDGLRTTYEPVTPTVAAGASVTRGAVVGVLVPGHPGCPTPCLHWGARRDRLTYVDPLLLLVPRRVRLLPVPDPWPDGPVPDMSRPRSAASGDGRRSPDGELLERAAQAPDEARVQLADPRLGDPEQSSDLGQRARPDRQGVGHLALGRGPPQAHRQVLTGPGDFAGP